VKSTTTRSPERRDVELFERVPCFHLKKLGESIVTSGLPTCLLGHKISRGPKAKPDGVFAEWSWDGRRLVLENDRYGMMPLFYFATEAEFCVSFSIFKLLDEGAPRELDWPALAVYLRTGYYVGDDTCFKAIRAVSPGVRLEWEDGRLSVSGGYHFAPSQHVSRKAAIEAYVSLFRAAMNRRMPKHNDFAVPLSGGRDSRHILLELCERKRPPRYCISGRRYPPATGEDERIAAVVARTLGVKHVIVDAPDGEIGALLTTNIITNMTAWRRAWKLSVSQYERTTVSASYDGIGGDVLSGGSSLDRRRVELIEAGRLGEYCSYELRDSDRLLQAIVPKPQYRLMSDEIALARLERELKRHVPAANPVVSFNFWNRTRRFESSSPYGVSADVRTVYSPFLDHDLCDFLIGLPAEMTLDRQLHDDAIRAAYPKYADLPYESRLPESAGALDRRHTFRNIRELTAYILRKRPRRLTNPSFVLPRLGAGLASFGSLWPGSWFVHAVLYLTQLESFAYSTSQDAALSQAPLPSPHALDRDDADARSSSAASEAARSPRDARAT
jgi:asparagine synthetase B (glutamine-hydrolysing)